MMPMMPPADSDDTPFRPGPEEREQMVAVAAYYLAERRGFSPGGQDEDWRRAEHQIDRMLAAMHERGIGREALCRTGLRNALRLWTDDG